MASRAGVILLILSMAMVAQASWKIDDYMFNKAAGFLKSRSLNEVSKSNGNIGDLLDVNEEMMMDSESNRRTLYASDFISYGAMTANRVPCNNRGLSYYNCNSTSDVNPYERSCTQATLCSRDW